MAPELVRFDQRLSPALARAAPAIYANIRSRGATGVRDWLSTWYSSAVSDPEWGDIWNAAVSVDMALAGSLNDAELQQRLATSDQLELHLRRLGSWVYKRRTHDKAWGHIHARDGCAGR